MEKLEGAEMQIGYCSACGQARQFQTSGGVSQEQLDEWATDECKCDEGREDRAMKKRYNKALKNIQGLFSTDWPETAQILEEALPFIVKDRISKVTIDTGADVKAQISVTAKGKVRVEKITKNKTLLEG